jgi:RES domain-containing protein
VTEFKSYRLVKNKRRDAAFDGEGARLYGGRWNSVGKKCVYLAAHESLAIVETLVHLNDAAALEDWCLFELTLNEKYVMELDPSQLPNNWFAGSTQHYLSNIGDGWLESGSSLGLIVPSAIARRDKNIILNPEHPEFAGAVSSAIQLEFMPDKRIFN